MYFDTKQNPPLLTTLAVDLCYAALNGVAFGYAHRYFTFSSRITHFTLFAVIAMIPQSCFSSLLKPKLRELGWDYYFVVDGLGGVASFALSRSLLGRWLESFLQVSKWKYYCAGVCLAKMNLSAQGANLKEKLVSSKPASVQSIKLQPLTLAELGQQLPS